MSVGTQVHLTVSTQEAAHSRQPERRDGERLAWKRRTLASPPPPPSPAIPHGVAERAV